MRHARRVGAAAVASSVSLLASLGLAQAIQVSDAPQAAGGNQTAKATARRTDRSTRSGPSRLLVIRRATPTSSSVGGGIVYVQAAPTTVNAPAVSAPAVAPVPPPAPITSSS